MTATFCSVGATLSFVACGVCPVHPRIAAACPQTKSLVPKSWCKPVWTCRQRPGCGVCWAPCSTKTGRMNGRGTFRGTSEFLGAVWWWCCLGAGSPVAHAEPPAVVGLGLPKRSLGLASACTPVASWRKPWRTCRKGWSCPHGTPRNVSSWAW